jgi:hypothetical protein
MSKARLELYVGERVAKFERFEDIKEFDLTFNLTLGLVVPIHMTSIYHTPFEIYCSHNNGAFRK